MKHKIVALLAGLILASGLQAEVMVKDTFALSTERTKAAELDGAKSEVGGATWMADKGLVFAGDVGNGYLTMTPPQDRVFCAKVKVPADMGDVIIVQGDVQPSKSGWVAVGIGEGGLIWKNGLFLLVEPSGNSQRIYCDDSGTTKSLPLQSTGKAKVKTDALNTLKLQYDKKANLVSMWLNDEPVLKDFHLDTLHFKPVTTYAGFSGYGQGAEVKLDNFIIAKP